MLNLLKGLVKVPKTAPLPIRSPHTPVVNPTPVVARTPTPGPTVAFLNFTTVMPDTQIATIVAALQIQVDRDFSPIWNVDANLVAIPKGHNPPAGAWIIFMMDETDISGALGYHDISMGGLPFAKIFAKTDQRYGLSISVTMSHELLEMLIDPYVQNCTFAQATNTTGTLYAYEVCDACQDDGFGYTINGVLVSDFVYPAWFEGFRAVGSTRFDFRSVINAPFTLAPGGYIGIFDVSASDSGWTQQTDQTVPSQRLVKGVHSRFARRKNQG